jgi:cytoskeletal protein CcmA (bactofilin family)
MLSFNPRDRAPGKDAGKTPLKPAIYEPPVAAAAQPGAVTRSAPAAPLPTPGMGNPPASAVPPSLASPPAPEVVAPVAASAPAEVPRSKLAVGVNIKLKGVEISDCDVFVIEGQVEATVHSKMMEIARPGTLAGTALIDVAEVHGEFSGELTARTKLIVHGTGRVSGKIRYGKLVVAEGGELTGDVKRLDDAAQPSSGEARTTAS